MKKHALGFYFHPAVISDEKQLFSLVRSALSDECMLEIAGNDITVWCDGLGEPDSSHQTFTYMPEKGSEK